MDDVRKSVDSNTEETSADKLIEPALDEITPVGTATGTTEEAAPPGKKKKRMFRYALLAFVIFLAIPYTYTSNPQSCTRCHEMKAYYTSWKKSSHSVAAKNCFECHVKMGTVSLWIYRISFYREIY